MARIQRYTRSVLLNRARPGNVEATRRTEGANDARQSMVDAQSAQRDVGQAQALLENIAAEQQKKQTRYDTIQRARAVSSFKSSIDEEFTRFESENDMTNPDSVAEFNKLIRNKKFEFLNTHRGSEDSAASLDVQLGALSDQYAQRASESSRAAQRKFITGQVDEHVSRIANEVYNNPASIEIGFKQLSGLMKEYGAALDSVDEMELISNAQSMVVEGALNSFIDGGDYESAQKLVQDNEQYIIEMPPKQQMSILGRIKTGLAAQEKERTELTRKMSAIAGAAEEAGVQISKSQLFTAATGIEEQQTPDQKVQAFAGIAGLDDSQITPAIVAKIGFGVDLPAGNVDMNSERLPDGGYTPKGIGKVIKAPYEAAASTKIQVEKVILQAEEFLNSGNKQAGLASLISFQKLIDDGAMVREGDIKLSAQGNSAFDNLQLMMDKISEGGIATPKQTQEMMASARIFGQSVLESSKTFIDPYLQESQERGYRMLDIGLPQQSYDRVFGNIKTAEDDNQRNREIEEKAKSYGMSVNDYITATAKKHNMDVQDAAKRLGYTGTLE